MFDLVKGFSGAIDMLNSALADHHLRVAVIADEIAGRLSLDEAERKPLLVSAMMHDLGSIALQDKPDGLLFEKDMASHCVAGRLMLESCPLMSGESRIVYYHHKNWRGIMELPEEERPLARLGNIIHLADSMDMCLRLHPGPEKTAWILSRGRGKAFEERGAEAALDFLNDPLFFDKLSKPLAYIAEHPAKAKILKDDEVVVFSRLFSYIIDSKSHFTAAHTTGVAWTGRMLHEMGGFDEADRQTMFVAGLLHDIGKVGVPAELLEKPGPLDKDEFAKVKRHAALSLSTLTEIPGFEEVAPWGALHHEKLNGKGYPGGLAAPDIVPESRLMAVADVMTALTEDRPYREGLDEEETVRILDNMVAQGGLDGDVTKILRDNYAEVNEARGKVQAEAREFFKTLRSDIAAKRRKEKSDGDSIGSLLSMA